MNLSNKTLDQGASEQKEFETFAREALDRGAEFHGDLGLAYATFRNRLESITRKNLRCDAAWWAIHDFARRLHTDDLYLAVACAAHSEAAWHRFTELYRKPLRDLHQFMAQGMETAGDMADHTLIDMFLPDRSGQSRIASYDGRSSLLTWLRVIVSNRAINERQRACNRVRKVEPEHEIADGTALDSLDSRIRAGRYQDLLLKSLTTACHELGIQDRLILLWRYEKGLQLGQIARLIGVHQSTITRQLDRALKRMKADVVEILTSQYQMTPAAVDECLETIADPAHHVSVLKLVRESTPPSSIAELERVEKAGLATASASSAATPVS